VEVCGCRDVEILQYCGMVGGVFDTRPSVRLVDIYVCLYVYSTVCVCERRSFKCA